MYLPQIVYFTNILQIVYAYLLLPKNTNTNLKYIKAVPTTCGNFSVWRQSEGWRWRLGWSQVHTLAVRDQNVYRFVTEMLPWVVDLSTCKLLLTQIRSHLYGHGCGSVLYQIVPTCVLFLLKMLSCQLTMFKLKVPQGFGVKLWRKRKDFQNTLNPKSH